MCTVGVLLRIMEETDPTLAGFDVIIVDEVHERSVENDLLLLALRRILTSRSRSASLAAGVAGVEADAVVGVAWGRVDGAQHRNVSAPKAARVPNERHH